VDRTLARDKMLWLLGSLDQQTAEHFIRTINTLKGLVTMIFITPQISRGLHVDAVVSLGAHGARMEVVAETGAAGKEAKE